MNSTDLLSGATQIHRSGGFELECNVDVAFPLFSPEGEREWVKGWDPEAVFPKTIAFARDTVFRTGEGNDAAVWTILDVDGEAHRAEYLRTATGSHTARILVQVESVGSERSRVTVDYVVTAFGNEADRILDSFSEEAYAARMRDWRERIESCLKTRV